MSADLAAIPRRADLVPGQRIEDIKVEGRHRKDLGDIQSLMLSIREVGLLQPIVVTADGRLIAGERRLEACRRLGWESVPVVAPESLTDAVSFLKAERDENVCRKGMLPSELAALGAALDEIETERGRERMANGGRAAAPGRPADKGMASGSHLSPAHTSRDAVGGALGMSGTTYNDLRSAYRLAHDKAAADEDRQAASDALAQMDAGRGIKAAAGEMRRKTNRRQKPAPVKEDEDWIPAPGTNRTPDAIQRRKLIKNWAAQNYSSRQMSELLGMHDNDIRAIARKEGIEIPADAIFSKTKRHNSNQIVEETVHALDGLAMGIQLVSPDELDPARTQEWAASLAESIRTISQLVRTMKGAAAQ